MNASDFALLIEAAHGEDVFVPAFDVPRDELAKHLHSGLLKPTNRLAERVRCPCEGAHLADVFARQTADGLRYFAACDAYARMENYPLDVETIRLYKVNPRMARTCLKNTVPDIPPFSPIDEQGRLKVTFDGVTEDGGKALREALKKKGGRPKKSERSGSYLSQKEVAKMFGSPCNESMVQNWERFERGEVKGGATPPSAPYNGKDVAYSAELRKNYSGENCEILAALIENFKSLHAVGQRLKDAEDDAPKPKVVRASSDETLYRMKHPDGRVRTANRR